MMTFSSATWKSKGLQENQGRRNFPVQTGSQLTEGSTTKEQHKLMLFTGFLPRKDKLTENSKSKGLCFFSLYFF